MFKKVLFALMACTICGLPTVPEAKAIVNTEIIHAKLKDKTPFYEISVSAEKKEGNTDVEKYSGGFSFGSQPSKKHQHIFLINTTYGESQGVTDVNNSFAHYRYQYKFDGLDWELFTQFEQDEFTQIKLRALLGTGLRIKLYDKENLSFHNGYGIFYEHTDYSKSSVQSTENFGRANIYLSMNYTFDTKSIFSLTGYFQPKVDEMDDYHTLVDASLSMPINTWSSLSLVYQLQHDNMPPEGVKKSDHKYLTQLNFNW